MFYEQLKQKQQKKKKNITKMGSEFYCYFYNNAALWHVYLKNYFKDISICSKKMVYIMQSNSKSYISRKTIKDKPYNIFKELILRLSKISGKNGHAHCTVVDLLKSMFLTNLSFQLIKIQKTVLKRTASYQPSDKLEFVFRGGGDAPWACF